MNYKISESDLLEIAKSIRQRDITYCSEDCRYCEYKTYPDTLCIFAKALSHILTPYQTKTRIRHISTEQIFSRLDKLITGNTIDTKKYEQLKKQIGGTDE